MQNAEVRHMQDRRRAMQDAQRTQQDYERILGEQDKLKSTSDEAVRYYNEHSIGMFEIPVDRQPTPMQKIMTATAQSNFWDEEWGNPEDDDSLDSSLESGSMPGSYA